MKDKDLGAMSEQELLLQIFQTADDFRDDMDGCDYMRFAWGKAQEYASAMGVEPARVIQRFEERRSYCTVNYYQEANFPSLESVHVFQTQDELKNLVDKGFRCPCCNGVSKSPYECDTGLKMEGGKVCDWKSYGLFGTLGKGLTFTVKETFFDHRKVETVFYPVGMEKQAA